MKIAVKAPYYVLVVIFVFFQFTSPGWGEEPGIDPCAAGVQSTKSVFEIYMPPP